MRKLKKFVIVVAAIAIAIVFIVDIYGPGDLDGAEDNRRSEAGEISGEPFTVEPVPDAGTRAYPDLKDKFAVPEHGVNAELVNTAAPGEDWTKDYAPSWGVAHLINGEPFVRATSEHGTVLVLINSRDNLDAVANPLLHPETREPVTEAGDLFIIDGVEYALTATQHMSAHEWEPGNEPLVEEGGRAVVVAFLHAEDGTPSGELVAFTLHRTAAQDNPAARFAQ